MSQEVEEVAVPEPPTPDFASEGAVDEAVPDGEAVPVTVADTVADVVADVVVADVVVAEVVVADVVADVVPDRVVVDATVAAADEEEESARDPAGDATTDAGDGPANSVDADAAEATASAGDAVDGSADVRPDTAPDAGVAAVSAGEAPASAEVAMGGSGVGAGSHDNGARDAAAEAGEAGDGEAGAGEAAAEAEGAEGSRKGSEENGGSEEFGAAGGGEAAAPSQAAESRGAGEAAAPPPPAARWGLLHGDDDGPPESLSTTGAPSAAEAPRGAVVLTRTADGQVRTLPPEVVLGGPGFEDACTLGRHSDNDLVLSIKVCSKVHCQFALRSFRLPGDMAVHQALFLRDVSKHRTLVNGKLAFRPWHWLQDGDRVGLHANGADGDGVLEFYQVCYRCHVKLPGDAGVRAAAAAAATGQAPAVSASGRTKPRGRGGGRGRGSAREASDGVPLDARAVGRVIDINYKDEDPPGVFRVRIVSFEKKRGWHKVDSEGLSVWDGEAFQDEVNLRAMYAEGHIVFVDKKEGGAKSSKRRRT